MSKPATSPTAQAQKPTENAVASLLAGATAGAFEGFVTYPTEYAKTQLQFAAGKGVQTVSCAHGLGTSPQISRIDRFSLNSHTLFRAQFKSSRIPSYPRDSGVFTQDAGHLLPAML